MTGGNMSREAYAAMMERIAAHEARKSALALAQERTLRRRIGSQLVRLKYWLIAKLQEQP